MPRVLVVDDEIAITTIISQFLQGAGFETETATSGEEALEKAFATRPDVAVIDIMMPDVDGYKVCRRLRRDPRTGRALILALTARGQPVDKQMAFRAGADAHVTKPFKGKAVIEQIQQLLADRTCTGPALGHQALVLRLKQGVGATTLATNLAICLADERGCQTAFADLVPYSRTAQDRLGLETEGSWLDSSQLIPDELVPHLIHHDSGMFVLPAPAPPGESRVAPSAVSRVLQMLRNWHDFAVLDTPLNLGTMAPVLLQSSALVLLVLTPETSTLRQAQASLTAIKKAGASSLRIWPVLNMVRPDQLAFEREVEQTWGTPVAAVLPWSPQECQQAIARRRPVVLDQPESPLAAAIRDLAQQIVRAATAKEKGEPPV